MQFDLTDLRLFVRTAEEGALTRAAARQHLSLASASARSLARLPSVEPSSTASNSKLKGCPAMAAPMRRTSSGRLSTSL